MQRYLMASGILWSFIALMWLCRLLFAVPIVVAGIAFPLLLGLVPLAVATLLATWAFRLVMKAGQGATTARP